MTESSKDLNNQCQGTEDTKNNTDRGLKPLKIQRQRSENIKNSLTED